MKKNLVILLIAIVNVNLAQVGGISGTKLLTPNAATLKQGHFDFEPSFSIFSSNRFYDAHGNAETNNLKEQSSNVAFRITLGLKDNFEIGTCFSSVLEEVCIGSKFNFLTSGNTSFSLAVGGSLPAGSFSQSEAEENIAQKYSYSFAFILSQSFSESISFDGLVSYSKINGLKEFDHLLNYSASIGYFLNGEVQLVAELNGFSTFNGSFYSRKISITPGITYQFSQYMLLVFGLQKDLWGNNEPEGISYITAFTMSF